MLRYKASEIPRNEVYEKYSAVTRDEGNEVDGRFPTTSLRGRLLSRGHHFPTCPPCRRLGPELCQMP
jgi:hypothetical protein